MAQGTVILPPDSTGKSLATDVRGDGAHMQAHVLYGPDGTVISTFNQAGNNSLAVAQSATNFIASTGNSTTAQLAAGATFAGAIETVYNQQAISILLTSDQPGTLTITQLIDAAGTRVASTWTYPIAAGVPYSRSLVANGNYARVAFQNTGGSTTTTLNLNVAYGTLPPATNLGNQPAALNEVAGLALTGQGSGSKGALDVNLAYSQGGLAAATQVITTNTVPGTPNTASTTSSCVIAAGAAGNCTFTLIGGSYTGSYTFVFEGSDDGGTTWVPVLCAREDGALSAFGDVLTGSAGAGPTHTWSTALPGFTHFRVRATTVPATVVTGITARITAGPMLVEFTPIAQSAPVDGSKRTYTTSFIGAALAVTAGDFIELRNASASTVVRVLSISLVFVSSTTTAGGLVGVQLFKRSSLDSGGTSSALTIAPHDSNDAAAAATAVYYTVVPTSLGTAIGAVRSWRIYIPANNATASPTMVTETFGNRPGKGIVLRNGQSLNFNFNGTVAAAPVAGGHIEWTEEAA